MSNPILHVNLDGDGAWPDLDLTKVIRTSEAHLSALPDGTHGGRPTIALRFDLPDGRVVVYETTVRQFLQVADLLQEKFGDGESGHKEWRPMA